MESKVVAGVESTPSVRAVKALIGFSFRGSARTVLRTGRTSTLHPWKGTGEELWFLAANHLSFLTLCEPAFLVRNLRLGDRCTLLIQQIWSRVRG